MQSKIMDLLISNPLYRKSDNALLARIWHDHLKFRINSMTAVDLLKELQKGNLPNHRTIVRTRAKLQSDNPYLKEEEVDFFRKELELENRMKYSPRDTL